jgi:hypothetical protein
MMFRKKVKSQAPEESETVIRLEALEQEVKALTRQPQRWRSSRQTPIRTVEDLRDALDGGRVPIDEGVRLIKAALQSGVERKLIEEEVRKVTGTDDNFKQVMDAVETRA